ncbi:MAG: ABC transporter substrate-binding protein [Chlamydiales bacterium]|nr:ABC transporter substrate-binding protein [Chlamydiales bacterium]
MKFGLILLFAVCWQLASLSPGLQFVLPSPVVVASVLMDHPQLFLQHSIATLREMLGGLFLATFVAFPLAIAMFTSHTAQRLVNPIIIVSQCFPMFALAPLMVIWFGWSYTAVVVPTALMVFFPLTVCFYRGFTSVPFEYLQQFDLMGASWWQTFWRLRLPWSMPQLCSGLRVAAGLAGMGAVVGEWAGAQQGLGVLMLESRRAADIATVFAAILCLVVLCLCFYACASRLENLADQRRPIKVLWNGRNRQSLLSCGCFAAAMLTFAAFPNHSFNYSDVSHRLLLDWLPNPNHVPLYVGVERGFFAKHGLPLHILKTLDPGDAIPYLTSGQADIAVTYMPSFVLGAQAQGADLEVVGYLVKEPLNAIITRPNVDLHNCKIGCATDGLQTPLLHALLSNNGFDTSSLVNINFDLVSMLAAEQVDAIFGAYWNIETENLRQLGIESRYVSVEELGMPRHFELILVSAKNKIDSDRFKAALQESIDWCRLHPDEAFALYAAANPNKTRETLDWEGRAWGKTIRVLANDQSDEPDVWSNYRSWLLQNKLLQE